LDRSIATEVRSERLRRSPLESPMPVRNRVPIEIPCGSRPSHVYAVDCAIAAPPEATVSAVPEARTGTASVTHLPTGIVCLSRLLSESPHGPCGLRSNYCGHKRHERCPFHARQCGSASFGGSEGDGERVRGHLGTSSGAAGPPARCLRRRTADRIPSAAEAVGFLLASLWVPRTSQTADGNGRPPGGRGRSVAVVPEVRRIETGRRHAMRWLSCAWSERTAGSLLQRVPRPLPWRGRCYTSGR